MASALLTAFLILLHLRSSSCNDALILRLSLMATAPSSDICSDKDQVFAMFWSLEWLQQSFLLLQFQYHSILDQVLVMMH